MLDGGTQMQIPFVILRPTFLDIAMPGSLSILLLVMVSMLISLFGSIVGFGGGILIVPILTDGSVPFRLKRTPWLLK